MSKDYSHLNGFRIVFSPINEESTVHHVSVFLEAADVEEAIEKARLSICLEKTVWRVFRAGPERLQRQES